MDGFFQAGIGLGTDMMAQMQAMMNSFDPRGHPGHPGMGHPGMGMGMGDRYRFRPDPVFISPEFLQEARFQPSYAMADPDLDDISQKDLRRMVQEKKKDTKHSYDEFEEKLEQGILDAPNLNLHHVPPSVFDNNPPITIMYLKENHICELPEFFFDELPYLAWLDLRDNKLPSLPAFDTRHECLRVLLLQGNRIRALPYTLGFAVNLKTIGLTGNPVTCPPEEIQKKGCKKILHYLQERMLQRVPIDEAKNLEILLGRQEGDEQLREDLKKTAKKQAAQKRENTLRHQASCSSINTTRSEQQRRADKMKYTWELWKRVPYDGVGKTELFQKSMEEMQRQVLEKLMAQQEAMLQKCKNREVLQKWRSETSLMQRTKKPDLKVNPTASAPFGNDLNEVKPITNHRMLRPDEYRHELEDCWDKLQKFAENPAPLSNTDLALQRLLEVEEIHKRILGMKIAAKPQVIS